MFILAAIVVLAAAPAAQAQLAVTSNDNKVMLDNGTVKIVQNPAPDTVTILDLKASPPRVVAEIAVPGSVWGHRSVSRSRRTRAWPSWDRRASGPGRSDEDGAGHPCLRHRSDSVAPAVIATLRRARARPGI